MNKPTIITVLIAVLLLGVVAYVFTREGNTVEVPNTTGTQQTTPEGTQPAEERQVNGTVESVNNEQVASDGPTLIVVRSADGTTTTIAVPSMGINLCAAQASMASVGSIRVGDQVEARGSVEAESGQVVPCASSTHYLRVVTPGKQPL